MFPLYDENPRATKPYVTWSLIVVNVIVFALQFASTEGFTDQRAGIQIFLRYGAIPVGVISALFNSDFLGLSPLLTSMFLHGGYEHIFGNMLYLHIFGDNIEDRFGHAKFLILYLLFGVAAGVIHSFNALLTGGVDAFLPAIGASGAISGVLGAYIVLYPKANVVTIVLLYFFLRLVRIPALFYLGFWFLLQTIYGITGSVSSVAYWAHIGGFATGGLIAGVVKVSRRWR